jgi:hypothetical protein
MTLQMFNKIQEVCEDSYDCGAVEEFPFCCGASVAGDLWNPGDVGLAVLTHVRDEVFQNLQRKPKPLFWTSIGQQRTANALIGRLGFHKLMRWKNPNTRRMVTLWVKTQFTLKDINICIKAVKDSHGD